ncbi:hypothetical protein RJ640_028238 [Escallonia rubra]|uniref:Uncharacterized protein n=1 Tax=Escallonia rubra TaxID=112253 RepID=A0AA88UV55_9ASTE|nr:hypothetical protein RJ640_028238 [Escallonia rubra]
MAVLTLVVQLESQQLAQIAKGVQRLTGSKNARIKTVIGLSLVAGFTIRYGKSGLKLIDMSVKKQFEEIAAQPDIGDVQLAYGNSGSKLIDMSVKKQLEEIAAQLDIGDIKLDESGLGTGSDNPGRDFKLSIKAERVEIDVRQRLASTRPKVDSLCFELRS